MFGVKRVILPKDTYGLDEDGWIDIRTRLTVRAAFLVQKGLTGADDLQTAESFINALVTGWEIKGDGEALVYSPEAALSLPVDILTLIEKEAQKLPFMKAGSSETSPPPSN